MIRITSAIMSAIAAFYFVLWFSAAAIFVLTRQLSFALLGGGALSVCIATAAGRVVWTRLSSGAPALIGAIVAGAVGFLAGFFGPIILTPGSNQGPLLGLFITGPVGAAVGAIGGLVVGRIRSRGPTQN